MFTIPVQLFHTPTPSFQVEQEKGEGRGERVPEIKRKRIIGPLSVIDFVLKFCTTLVISSKS